jgi:predicted nuclease of restriction endonuclease-like (RecB) superfamily
MADSAKMIENEIDRRKYLQEEMQSRADVEEINRRIESCEKGAEKTYSREDVKKILEDMGYRG